MNRRHEHLSCQSNKNNIKCVKEGIDHDTPDTSPKKKKAKKTASKKKADEPPKSENKWGDMLQKQTEENERRLQLQENEEDR